jgi:uncharacterized alpha/beta hydrolase family protein
MTFFTILSVLIGLNIAIVVASLNSVNKKKKKPTRLANSSKVTVIYPIDLLTSGYKKAV